jgi:hypothetical protein
MAYSDGGGAKEPTKYSLEDNPSFVGRVLQYTITSPHFEEGTRTIVYSGTRMIYSELKDGKHLTRTFFDPSVPANPAVLIIEEKEVEGKLVREIARFICDEQGKTRMMETDLNGDGQDDLRVNVETKTSEIYFKGKWVPRTKKKDTPTFIELDGQMRQVEFKNGEWVIVDQPHK